MKVLITGASGRLGYYVAKDLEAHGHDLVLTSRSEPGEDLSNWPWVQADINVYADCEKIAEAGPFDAIQHVAAVPFATDYPGREETARERGFAFDATMHTNIMGTYYLLRMAVKNDIDIFVMSGSNCAIGHCGRINGEPFPIQYLPLDEAHPTDLQDSYSYSKFAGEELLASYTRAYGIRTLTVRPAWIWDEDRRKSMAENFEPFTKWEGGFYAWVGSEDVASAQRLLMEQAYDLPPTDVYFCNASDTRAVTPSRELVEKYRPDLVPVIRDLEGHASFFSNQKLKDAVGWEHTTSWRKHLPDQS
jgi:UDP-glucose 4-epimerase